MGINHTNLIRAGFKNVYNVTLRLYNKEVVQVSILRESGIEGEFIILVGNQVKEETSNIAELSAFCSFKLRGLN